MNLLSLCCGFMIPIIFGGIVLVSEFNKLWLNWDGSYLGMSWLKIWRIERAYRRGDMKEYMRLMHHE